MARIIGRRARVPLLVLPVLLALGGLPAPASAASGLVKLALSVSPNPAVDGTTVAYKGTITRVSGTPRNVQVFMEGHWYPGGGESTCTPAAYCHIDQNVYWTLPSVTSSVTIRFTTPALTGWPVKLYLNGGAGCSGTCPAMVTLSPPKVSASISYTSDSWPVMPGTTLHVAVRGSTTAGPLPADVQGKLSDGFDPPTNISPETAVYAPPPYNYIDDNTTLNRTATLRFDTRVTAAVGSNIRLTGNVYSAYRPATTVAYIHVGPATRYEETSSRLHWAGTWRRVSSASAWGGATRYTKAAGASVSLTFTGWGIAWVSPMGPSRGSARVYIDGVRVKTVSLYSPAGRSRVVAYSKYWGSRKTHTVKIVNVATAGHPRIDVDAFLVAR